MSQFKDLYIAELEAEWARLEDQGIPSDLAYDLATSRAHASLKDKLADRADYFRLLRKES